MLAREQSDEFDRGRSRRGYDAEAQPAGELAARRSEALDEGLVFGERPPRPGDDGIALDGEAAKAVAAHDDLDAEFLFELPDRRGECRLRYLASRGRACEMLFAREGGQEAQVPQEHRSRFRARSRAPRPRMLRRVPSARAHWLPFTPSDGFASHLRTFERGYGTSLVDAAGRTVFDAISSVWTTIHGHGRPEIVAAIAAQAERLDHATALGATNPVAEELAERLAALAGLARVLFASDGASAIEVALKIAIQYQQQGGDPHRTRFAHLRDAYHGDTAGAMGVSDLARFRARFAALTIESLRYDDLAAALERDDLAAVIVEPRVQAAAGMRLVPVERYAPLRGQMLAARASRPLVIVDEIATGFGRTGTVFAFEPLGLRPDVVCVGKGLTGGALALAATIVSGAVADAFDGTLAQDRHLQHGHSYAGNPIACAAALASLELFATDGTLARVADLDGALEGLLEPLRRLPLVREIRRAGLMAGIELDARRIDAAGAASPAWRIADAMYARGHFTRPIGATIQLVPPLTASVAELRDFTTALADALGEVA